MKNLLKYFIIFCLLGVNIVCLFNTGLKPATMVAWYNAACNFSKHNSEKIVPYLNSEFEKYGYDFQCDKTNNLNNTSFVLVARTRYSLPDNITAPSFLWLQESPLSIQIPVPEEEAKKYRRIFTYSQKFVDNKKYFYLPIPYDYNQHVLSVYPKLADKNILIAQVAGNHYNPSHLEQYSERRQAVKYFVKNHPEDFLLYGGDWKRMLPFFNEAEKQAFTRLYKGPIPEKKTAFIPAKFVLAYENAIFDDYISEKIFDAMAFGAVPVYLGASNITDYVPKDCFINRNDFSSYDELYAHLKNMPDETYEKYLTCMESFMKRKNHFNDFDTFFHSLFNELLLKLEMSLWEKTFLQIKYFIGQKLNGNLL